MTCYLSLSGFFFFLNVVLIFFKWIAKTEKQHKKNTHTHTKKTVYALSFIIIEPASYFPDWLIIWFIYCLKKICFQEPHFWSSAVMIRPTAPTLKTFILPVLQPMIIFIADIIQWFFSQVFIKLQFRRGKAGIFKYHVLFVQHNPKLKWIYNDFKHRKAANPQFWGIIFIWSLTNRFVLCVFLQRKFVRSRRNLKPS